MPPRFQDSNRGPIRQRLLLRAPGCFLTADDVEALHLSEGLDKAQILKYASHFRDRVAEEDRVQNLEEMEKSNKVNDTTQFGAPMIQTLFIPIPFAFPVTDPLPGAPSQLQIH